MWQENGDHSPDQPQVARLCSRVSRIEIRSGNKTVVSHRQQSYTTFTETDKTHVPESSVWDENFSLGWRLDQPYVPLWSKRFSYENIEDEHKMLFSAMLDLEKTQDKKKAVLDFCRLLNAHFMHEEMMFRLAGCPENPQHRIQCKNFLENLHHWTAPDKQDMISYVREWLTNHVAATDSHYKGKRNPRLFSKPWFGSMLYI
ncbi:neurohemerythrin-like [Lingula anatina]|uniref:Neurohemerythrin-like n=1 Tax=Lingula anatina TaxID=7574 RepID=A0A1S3I8A1_LINAN|nr:neurohemerythrin-like [Lingula anatina]|eukprot:XP_013393604.1 neurohemerythrin-like [Lingula anatina]